MSVEGPIGPIRPHFNPTETKAEAPKKPDLEPTPSPGKSSGKLSEALIQAGHQARKRVSGEQKPLSERVVTALQVTESVETSTAQLETQLGALKSYLSQQPGGERFLKLHSEQQELSDKLTQLDPDDKEGRAALEKTLDATDVKIKSIVDKSTAPLPLRNFLQLHSSLKQQHLSLELAREQSDALQAEQTLSATAEPAEPKETTTVQNLYIASITVGAVTRREHGSLEMLKTADEAVQAIAEGMEELGERFDKVVKAAKFVNFSLQVYGGVEASKALSKCQNDLELAREELFTLLGAGGKPAQDYFKLCQEFDLKSEAFKTQPRGSREHKALEAELRTLADGMNKMEQSVPKEKQSLFQNIRGTYRRHQFSVRESAKLSEKVLRSWMKASEAGVKMLPLPIIGAMISTFEFFWSLGKTPGMMREMSEKLHLREQLHGMKQSITANPSLPPEVKEPLLLLMDMKLAKLELVINNSPAEVALAVVELESAGLIAGGLAGNIAVSHIACLTAFAAIPQVALFLGGVLCLGATLYYLGRFAKKHIPRMAQERRDMNQLMKLAEQADRATDKKEYLERVQKLAKGFRSADEVTKTTVAQLKGTMKEYAALLEHQQHKCVAYEREIERLEGFHQELVAIRVALDPGTPSSELEIETKREIDTCYRLYATAKTTAAEMRASMDELSTSIRHTADSLESYEIKVARLDQRSTEASELAQSTIRKWEASYQAYNERQAIQDKVLHTDLQQVQEQMKKLEEALNGDHKAQIREAIYQITGLPPEIQSAAAVFNAV